jgi:hypothetical protein
MVCHSFCQLVDLMPTIAALAGLALPAKEAVEDPLDGVSFVPMLTTDAATISTRGGGEQGEGTVHAAQKEAWARQGKVAAFSQYPRRVSNPARAWSGNSIIHHERSTFTHMGYSIRTKEYRLTQWVQWNGTQLLPIWSNITASELYDHRNESYGSAAEFPIFPTDFDARENANIAAQPEFAPTVAALSLQLRAQFHG